MPQILIVDDDPDIHAMLSAIIGSLGYQTTSASSGEAALEKVKQQSFDLVLLDHHMGGMSGVDTAKVLHQQGIPFLFCTSSTDDETLRHALAQGALNYIVKPFTATKVIFAVASSLARIEKEAHNHLIHTAAGILMARRNINLEAAHQYLKKITIKDKTTTLITARHLIDAIPEAQSNETQPN